MRTKLTIGLIALAAAGTALAQAPNAADTIKARQAGMKAVGAGFKGLRDQFKGTPNPAEVKKHAAAVSLHASKVSGWFGPGTATAAGIKTAALPTIWTQNAQFRKAAAEFDVQAKKMMALANAGDMAGVEKQIQPLGGTCKGCHDNFKAKDD